MNKFALLLCINTRVYCSLRGTDTHSGKITLLNCVCLLSEKGPTLKRKILLHIGVNFFPFRVDPFSAGAVLHEYKQEVTKVVKDYGKSTKYIQSP